MTATRPGVIARRHRRDVTDLFEALDHATMLAIGRHTNPGEPITEQQRRAIMSELDDALALVYGPSRSAANRSALHLQVVAGARDATLAPFDAMIDHWQSVDADLAAEMLEDQPEQG